MLTRHSDKKSNFEKLGCKVYQISYEPFYQTVPYDLWLLPAKYIVRGIEYMYGKLFAEKRLIKQMDIREIDLIHSNSSREDFGAQLSEKYGIPLVWHIREFGDLDYKCYSYRKNILQFMNSHATIFVAISKAVREHWINKGIDEKKVVQIYNGVNVNCRVKKTYPRKGGRISLVMMGAVKETKGQEEIIQAITRLSADEKKRIRLDIIGDGPRSYFGRLKRIIYKNKLQDQVKLLGYKKDVVNFLYQYDCGIMCSRSEGFGRVTVEYMMAGLPVIATDSGANSELIDDQRNGLLYKQGYIEQLIEKIRYILNHEYSLEKMGCAAYDEAIKKYTSNNNAKEIYNLYLTTIKKR